MPIVIEPKLLGKKEIVSMPVEVELKSIKQKEKQDVVSPESHKGSAQTTTISSPTKNNKIPNTAAVQNGGAANNLN